MLPRVWTWFFLVAGFTFAAPEAAFQHKQHAPLKLKCNYCHATAEKQERAGFPAITQCRTCHVDIRDRKIPSTRIYRVKDFVVFSHAVHLAAKAVCSDCHGDVSAKAVLSMERPTTMIACVECHKERNATQRCNSCHELGQ
jgi:hypothetical protein